MTAPNAAWDGSDAVVWAVDVSQWNCAPFTRVDARHGPRAMWMDALDNEVVSLLDPFDARAAGRARRYHRGVDRARSLVGSLLPRVMMQDIGGCAWSELQLTTTPAGRPHAANPASVRHLDYNVSHDGDWVVMAFSPTQRVGVDVMEVGLPSFEANTSTFCETMKTSMTDREYEWVHAGASDEDMLSRLMDLWTYKESFTKNIGLGLGFNFRRVEVLRDDATHAMELRIDGRRSDRYRLLQLTLPGGAARRVRACPVRVAVIVGPHDHAIEPRHAPLAAKDAVERGCLRMWTYDEFLAHAHEVCRPPRSLP